MDVLAENGELLGQVAVATVGLVIALARTDPAVGPMVVRVRTAAAHRDVVPRAPFEQDGAQALQVEVDAVHVRPRQGADLDHALGDLEFDFTETLVVVEVVQQIRGGTRQVVIAQRQELEFQFDAQAEGRTGFEFGQKVLRHRIPFGRSSSAASPDQRKAWRHSSGPTSSMIVAANKGSASAERPTSGYRPTSS